MKTKKTDPIYYAMRHMKKMFQETLNLQAGKSP